MKLSVGIATASCLEHKHNCYEIIFYREAKGYFCLQNKKLPISSGQFIIVPPNTMHASKYESEAEAVVIKGDFQHIFSFSFPAVVMDNSEKEGEFLVDMICKSRVSKTEYQNSLANALAHFLLQNIEIEKNINLAIHNIANEIYRNFSDSNIDLKEILTRSGYAEDYIRAKFKSFTGKTPVGFLTEIRINHARYLIEVYKNSLSLVEVAEKCGYTDYLYFSRRFKEIMGVSPKNYIQA